MYRRYTDKIMNIICIEGTLMSEKVSFLFGFINSYENSICYCAPNDP